LNNSLISGCAFSTRIVASRAKTLLVKAQKATRRDLDPLPVPVIGHALDDLLWVALLIIQLDRSRKADSASGALENFD
jgi:hypothetical protein